MQALGGRYRLCLRSCGVRESSRNAEPSRFPEFSDMKTGLSDPFMSLDKSAIKEAVPAQGAVKEKEETTSASGSAEPMLLNSPF